MATSNFYQDFLFGSISASISKTIIAPLERVKLLLQLQDASTQISAEKKYRGIIDCFVRVNREQGVASFWRGNWANVVRYFPTTAFTFATKDWFKRTFLSLDANAPKWKAVLANMLAGGFAGAAATIVSYPLDYARTRLAADIGKAANDRLYQGMMDCMQKTYKTDGMVGLYRGVMISVPGFMVYRASYFGLYDSIKELLKEKNITLGFFPKFVIAQLITSFSGTLYYPFDTVRRRMMMQSGRSDVLYSGTLDCIRKIHAEEGVVAFFKGGFTNVLRSTGGALVLILYDVFKDSISK